MNVFTLLRSVDYCDDYLLTNILFTLSLNLFPIRHDYCLIINTDNCKLQPTPLVLYLPYPSMKQIFTITIDMPFVMYHQGINFSNILSHLYLPECEQRQTLHNDFSIDICVCHICTNILIKNTYFFSFCNKDSVVRKLIKYSPDNFLQRNMAVNIYSGG